MKRCSKCNNRKLQHCKGEDKSCECKCTKYIDTVKNRPDPGNKADPVWDEFIKNLNERWRKLHQNENINYVRHGETKRYEDSKGIEKTTG